ncbi:hypothetical protein HpBT171_04650 [Helicobacter pylori]
MEKLFEKILPRISLKLANKKIFQNDYSKDRVAMRKSIFDMGHKDIFCEGKLGRSIYWC